MDVTFYGAAGGVTGSKHLIDYGDGRLLLDCGMWQGLSDTKARNRIIPFAPDSVDAVILSHAHIDHSGMLPLLVKRGFSGPIYATPATKDVVKYMLADTAKIERYDAEYRTKHKIGAPDEREPLFSEEDVDKTIEQIETMKYAREDNRWFDVNERIRLKFYDAGHILGSAITVIEFKQSDGVKRLLYSGDIGPPGMPLLYDPQMPDEDIDAVILESTYGSRDHEPSGTAEQRLADTVNKICERGGKMIVPAFSLGRTQGLVYILHRLTDQGRIPRFPIYVDSPLATNLTEVYQKYRHDYDVESWSDFDTPDHTPLAFRNLTYTQSSDESKALNHKEGPFMVISASGMMTAGRVVHHLRNTITDSRNAIFITGYQARGTLGRRLLQGAKWAELFGRRYPVRAEICLFNEFSAHADGQQLQAYVERLDGVSQVFLVHGESSQADRLAKRLADAHADWQVERPDEGETFDLFVPRDMAQI